MAESKKKPPSCILDSRCSHHRPPPEPAHHGSQRLLFHNHQAHSAEAKGRTHLLQHRRTQFRHLPGAHLHHSPRTLASVPRMGTPHRCRHSDAGDYRSRRKLLSRRPTLPPPQKQIHSRHLIPPSVKKQRTQTISHGRDAIIRVRTK